jgi:negative regulator of flagellin synthesis FlgM
MRINPNSSPVQNANTSESQSAKKSEKLKNDNNERSSKGAVESRSNGSANAEISSKARDMAAAKQVATDAPDVREAKIAALREQIAQKKYNVGADAIADKLVDDHIRMSGA